MPPDLALDLAGGGGGGGAGFGLWRPDAPPDAPENENDEFTASAIKPNWTEVDPGGLAVWSMDTVRKNLKAVVTAPGGAVNQIAGLLQAVPVSNEWALYSRVSIQSDIDFNLNNTFEAGICFGGTLFAAPTTQPWRGIGQAQWHTPQATARQSIWGNYQSVSFASDRTTYGLAVYLRLRVNAGTMVSCEVSPDGESWCMCANGAIGYTPSTFGVYVASYGGTAGRRFEARWQFFRVFSGVGTSAYNGSQIGKYVTT